MIKGAFDVKMTAQPPYSSVDGVTLGRVTFDKQFHGPLDAKGAVEMLAARTPVADSAGYVALEQVSGSLEGRTGSFVLQQRGVMTRGKSELTVTVVPDSGTGQLKGLRGQMTIEIVEGKHFYTFDYELSG